jgi:hypothetical protein
MSNIYALIVTKDNIPLTVDMLQGDQYAFRRFREAINGETQDMDDEDDINAIIDAGSLLTDDGSIALVLIEQGC